MSVCCRAFSRFVRRVRLLIMLQWLATKPEWMSADVDIAQNNLAVAETRR